MEPIDLFIAEIKEHPVFPALVELLEENIPVLPEFDPERDNIEEWKQKSGMRKGFKLCLAIMKIRR
jgi:hypothetical protein